MEPYIRPVTREALFYPSSRRTTFARQSRLHHGTLNLFATTSATDAKQSSLQEGGAGGSRPASRSGSARGRLSDPNRESTATREFPSSGIRHVKQPMRTEPVQGIRQVSSARGLRQNIEIVNISAAYRDPSKMETPRAAIRCDPQRGASSDVKNAINYSAAGSNQLRGALEVAPVGRPKPQTPLRTLDYTRQEHFCQAVRDHVQQRSRGVANFYFLLCRDMIGDVTASTPRPEWRLVQAAATDDDEPPSHALTLARCRDQLVSLTGIEATPLEVADVMWDMTEYTAADATPLSDADLGRLAVPFKDFAAAFGANSSNVRLAVKKL